MSDTQQTEFLQLASFRAQPSDCTISKSN